MANGMLQQAAQAAGQVPAPAALQQPAPGAPPAGAPAPGAPAPGAPPGGPAAAPPAPGTQLEPPGSPVPDQPQAALPGGAPVEEPGFDMGEEEATARENREYERALAALEKILYQSDEISNSIMAQIDPNDKIGTTAKASILTVNQLDDQIDLDEIVIPQITQDVVDRISELAEARYNMEYGDGELQATLGATWEGVMEMFGVDEDDFQQLSADYGEEQLTMLESKHKQFLGT